MDKAFPPADCMWVCRELDSAVRSEADSCFYRVGISVPSTWRSSTPLTSVEHSPIHPFS